VDHATGRLPRAAWTTLLGAGTGPVAWVSSRATVRTRVIPDVLHLGVANDDGVLSAGQLYSPPVSEVVSSARSSHNQGARVVIRVWQVRDARSRVCR
jgi:hypothetical protein